MIEKNIDLINKKEAKILDGVHRSQFYYLWVKIIFVSLYIKQKQLKINSKIKNRSLNFVKLVFMDNTEKLQSLENEILALVEEYSNIKH